MSLNVFACSTYKDYLKGFIKQHETRGLVSQIAEACGCDRTYISQVLNGKADLTPDHMVQFCETFRVGEQEANFLLLLLLRDRSASLKARKKLDEKLKALKAQVLTVSNKVFNSEKPKELKEELRNLYYSHWIYSAIHILTSIPEFQTPAAIAQKIQVSQITVTQVLQSLVEMGLVTIQKGRFFHSGGDIYLSRELAQSTANHLNWRMKAVERSLQPGDVHYTLTFSLSKSDVEKFRLELLELIEKQRKFIRDSGTETACVFCLDYFAF